MPDDKAQRNFTVAEPGIMPRPGVRNFLQAYNRQMVVDHEHQVIVAVRATDQSSYKQREVVMIEETIANFSAVPREMSADAGCYPARAIEDLRALGADPCMVLERVPTAKRRQR